MYGGLHRFDAATATWTNLTDRLRGHPPGVRVGAGMAAASGRLVVYGGFGEEGRPRGHGVFEIWLAIFDEGGGAEQGGVVATDSALIAVGSCY
jgi:hypothetical protein